MGRNIQLHTFSNYLVFLDLDQSFVTHSVRLYAFSLEISQDSLKQHLKNNTTKQRLFVCSNCNTK
jgi:hypothetical protein